LEIVKIVKATPDLHLILSEITFDGKAFWGFSEAILNIWREELTITEKYILENETYTLLINDQIVGYYSFLKLSETLWKLDNLFLFQKFIGKGYGKFLMEDFLKRSKISGIKSLILDAEPNAEKFYLKFGFKVYELKESKIIGRFLPKMRLDF
jgi:GNAT superfamily N-acetyltransferase